MYAHFQIGGQEPYYIDASRMDFRYTSQRELGLAGMKIGEYREVVNLFNAGINPYSLAFGKVTMTKMNTSQFFIHENNFDFNMEWENGLTRRNVETALGYMFLHSSIIPYKYGGGYPVRFTGNATISY